MTALPPDQIRPASAGGTGASSYFRAVPWDSGQRQMAAAVAAAAESTGSEPQSTSAGTPAAIAAAPAGVPPLGDIIAAATRQALRTACQQATVANQPAPEAAAGVIAKSELVTIGEPTQRAAPSAAAALTEISAAVYFQSAPWDRSLQTTPRRTAGRDGV